MQREGDRMAPMVRPDLDGCQLREPDSTDLWIVLHGRRHRVPASASAALFRDELGVEVLDDLPLVVAGLDLGAETCLVRADDDLTIYLLVVLGDQVERHPIGNWESFCDFRFAESLVRRVPRAVLGCVPLGPAITSAASRSV